MKYQIYLNKETSMLVNELAEKNKQEKPATFLKKFIESFMKIYKSTQEEVQATLEDLKANGDK